MCDKIPYSISAKLNLPQKEELNVVAQDVGPEPKQTWARYSMMYILFMVTNLHNDLKPNVGRLISPL
jgi:hypothetical protein